MFSCDTMVVNSSCSKYGSNILAKNSDRPTAEAQPLCSYVGREYEDQVEEVKTIVNIDMDSGERSQFVNLITSTVDKDVQDFLYEYFDIDTSI